MVYGRPGNRVGSTTLLTGSLRPRPSLAVTRFHALDPP